MASNAADLISRVVPLEDSLMQMLNEGRRTLQILEPQPCQEKNLDTDGELHALKLLSDRNRSILSRAQSDLAFLTSRWPISTDTDLNLQILKQQQIDIISLASKQEAAIRLQLGEALASDPTDVETEPGGRQPEHQGQNQSTTFPPEGTQSASGSFKQETTIDIPGGSSCAEDNASSANEKTDAAKGFEDNRPAADSVLQTAKSQALDIMGIQHGFVDQIDSSDAKRKSKGEEPDQEPARCDVIVKQESNDVLLETPTRIIRADATGLDTEIQRKQKNTMERQHILHESDESEADPREVSSSISSCRDQPPGPENLKENEVPQESQELQTADQFTIEEALRDPELEMILVQVADDSCTTFDGLAGQEFTTTTQDRCDINPINTSYSEPEEQNIYGDLALLLDAEYVTARHASAGSSPRPAEPSSHAAFHPTIPYGPENGIVGPHNDGNMEVSSPAGSLGLMNKSPVPRRRLARIASTWENPLYEAPPGPDGLFHCPWEGDGSCKHEPRLFKSLFHRALDAHLKPFRCEVPHCTTEAFSSDACLSRHKWEAHSNDSRAFLCPDGVCKRSLPENGFHRYWNLKDHAKRVHGLDMPSRKKTERKKPRKVQKLAGQKRTRAEQASEEGASGAEGELKGEWDSRLAGLRSVVRRFGSVDESESLKLVDDAQKHLACMSRIGNQFTMRK